MFDHVIIDRRPSGKNKSSGNRHKFLKRIKDHVKQSVRDSIVNNSVKSLGGAGTTKVKVKSKDLTEPTFTHHSTSGSTDIVLPGNDQWSPGDKIDKEGQGDGAKGSEGSANGEGDDDFEFTLSKEEFLNIFFEDLELPDMIKQNLQKTLVHEMKPAGFVRDGTPNNLNVVRTFRSSKGRKFALSGAIHEQIRELEAQIMWLESFERNEDEQVTYDDLVQQLDRLRGRLAAIPFIDKVDLRYNHKQKVSRPSTSAVMFCIMDVSASMDEDKKELAKRFFILLYLFLQRQYERLDIVFIRHHDSAKEVDEQEFFYSHESGGTIVSSALELMTEIIKKRYDTNVWNVYACQASDGDTFSPDNLTINECMINDILPVVQYYAYLELSDQYRGNRKSPLWILLEKIATTSSKLQMKVAGSAKDIYPVFRELFEKRTITK